MPTFPFELVSPERVLFSGQVSEVILPASEGEMTVMAGHAPFVTTLRPGVVFAVNGGVGERVVVRGGFAEVGPEGLTLLAERATPLQEVTPAMLDAEILHAETLRDSARDDDARRAADATVTQLQELRGALATG